jgi:putative intracellular protease/amidase
MIGNYYASFRRFRNIYRFAVFTIKSHTLCGKTQKPPMEPLKILLIATSHEKLGDTGRKTGVWLEELACPYFIFRDAGAKITLASPNGGPIPLDPKSESIIVANSYTKKFLKDPEVMSLLAHPVALDTVSAINFDLVLVAGGHGALWDLAENGALTYLLEDFSRQHKLIAAVCHGVAALAPLRNTDGEWLVKGRQLTAFSDNEEKSAGLTDAVPFLLESRLVSLGARYSKAADHTSHTVTDGRIITGQNPSSSAELARKILLFMKLNAPIPENFALN